MRNGALVLGLVALFSTGCGAENGSEGDDSIDAVTNELVTTTQRGVNCGGPAVGGVLVNGNMTLQIPADQGFNGGTTINHPEVAIDISKVPRLYAPALFQTARVGTKGFSYVFGPFPANQKSEVHLLFAETYFKRAEQRQFDVSINAAPVLASFDILREAGAKGAAIEKIFTTVTDESGFVKVQFSPVKGKDQPLVSGILVYPVIPPTMP